MNKLVFLIEDDHLMRNAVRRCLTRGFPFMEIVDIDGGTMAKDILSHSIPDLILLDIMMPGMSGLNILKYIKNSNDSIISNIPVIMLTAVGNREIAHEAKKIGAVDYITKPFNGKILVLKIKAILEKK